MSPDTIERDDEVRAALHELAASYPAPSAEDPVAAVRARTSRRGRSRRTRIVLATAAAIAVVIGTVAVIAARDNEPLDIATDPTAPSVTIAPPGPRLPMVPVYLGVGPQQVLEGMDVQVRVRNDSDAAVRYGPVFLVSRWNGSRFEGVARVLGDEWYEPGGGPTLDYTAVVVEPGDVGPPISLRVPLGTAPGTYVVELEEAGSDGVDGLLVVEGRFEVVKAADYRTDEIDLADGTLEGVRSLLPDSVTVLDDDRVALAFTTSCNRPADSVAFTAHSAGVGVELRVGSFLVIDCVGEPGEWTLVVSTPEPIGDRPVFAVEDTGRRLAATRAQVTDVRVVLDEIQAPDAAPAASLPLIRSANGFTYRWFTPESGCDAVRITALSTDAETYHAIERVPAPGIDCAGGPGMGYEEGLAP